VSGRAGLLLTGASVACTIAVAVAGPSLMEPPLPGSPGQPPWSFDLRLSPYLAVGLAAAGLATGTLGLALTLRALRAGWRVSPRALLLAGAAVAVLAGTTRPFGSSDFLSYAAYGRELVTGYNPYVVTPAALARLGDPVARAVQDWAGTPSVYGALASGVFGLASLIGGTSVRLTVFVLDLVNAAAFVATGVLVDRLARGCPGARLRAAVLWTCNPLLLQILVAGGHVDSLAVAFGVAGIVVVAPAVGGGISSPAAVSRGLAAGALIGLGFAVKPTIVLIGIGIGVAIAFTSRSADSFLVRSGKPRYLAIYSLTVGFAAVAGADLALIGGAGFTQTMRASGMVSVGSPWRVVRTVLSQFMAESVANQIVRDSAIVLVLLLGAGFLARMRVASPDGRRARGGALAGQAAFALALAWLVAWPYVLPWYDALAWALLPLLPVSGLDWVLLARTAALGFGYLPARSAGITIPAGLRWMEPVIRSAVTPAALAAVTVLAGIVMLRRTRPKAVSGYGMMRLCALPIWVRKGRLPRPPRRACAARGCPGTWSPCRTRRSERRWRRSGPARRGRA
jgi:hypothetical protein